MRLVWNEDDESSSVLKATTIAVESEFEADDQITDDKNENIEIPANDPIEEQKDEVIAGEHFNT